MIPYGRHSIDESDIEAVLHCLRKGTLTQGPYVQQFEEAIAEYVGAKFAVAVSSGTAALHLAMIVAGVGQGDSVITSPITFVASANAALYTGASILFADIDSDSINISKESLRNVLESNSNVNAVIPVHYAGLAGDMKYIQQLAKQNNSMVVEDAAHAFGGSYQDGSQIGNCKYSDMTMFSFHPVKSIATGEGGMITTNNPEIYQQLLRIRSHGISKAGDQFFNKVQAYTNGKLNQWYYEMQELGFNYRITDIQCALGISQLKKIDNFMKRRKQLANRYDIAFKDTDIISPAQVGQHGNSANHIYPVRINFEKARLDRVDLIQYFRDHNIIAQVHYVPVPMQPYYSNLGFKIEDYPESLKYYQETLSLPLYYDLLDDEQEKVISILLGVL